MERTKDIFMEMRAKMSLETFEKIPLKVREEIQIKTIEPANYDYTKYPQWVKAKEQSDKAYKELKRLEYNIRHNVHE